MEKLNVELKILDQRIKNNLPKYATSGSAAVDIFACINKPLNLNADESQLIGSGISIHIGNPKYAAIILPRSGLGHKNGIVLGNLTGLIDSDYQGEILVSLWNRSKFIYQIQPMERIAQMMIIPVLQVNWQVVEEFKHSSRGSGGFGSTG